MSRMIRVTEGSSMKASARRVAAVTATVTETNSMLGIIRRGTENKFPRIKLPLFGSVVQLWLQQGCVVQWESPSLACGKVPGSIPDYLHRRHSSLKPCRAAASLCGQQQSCWANGPIREKVTSYSHPHSAQGWSPHLQTEITALRKGQST